MNVITDEENINEIKSSTEVNGKFDFKYISRNDFISIYKKVQRRRREELEKKKWDVFFKKKINAEEKHNQVKQLNNSIPKEIGEECFQTILSKLEAHLIEQSRIKSHDHKKDELMEASQNRLSLQLPPEDEILDGNALGQGNPGKKDSPVSRNIHTSQKKDTIQIPDYEDGDDNETLDDEDLNYLILKCDFNKVETFRTKMIICLRNIHQLILKGPDLSDKEEFDRIKKRSVEFSNRFKRNYLYQIQCLVNDLDKMITEKLKKGSMENFTKKITSLHQSFVLTLQAMEKNLPKISVDASFTFFNDFFMIICEICRKFRSFFKLPPEKEEDEIVSLCENVMDAMIDLIKVKPSNKKVKKEIKKTKDDLWMYSNNKKSWFSKAASLAKSKSKQKNQNNCLEKDHVQPKNHTLSNSVNGSSISGKSKLVLRKRNCIPEDDIKTMVEMTELMEPEYSETNSLVFDANPMIENTFANVDIAEEKISQPYSASPTYPSNSRTPPATPVGIKTLNNPRCIGTKKLEAKNVALICLQSSVEERAISPEGK